MLKRRYGPGSGRGGCSLGTTLGVALAAVVVLMGFVSGWGAAGKGHLSSSHASRSVVADGLSALNGSYAYSGLTNRTPATVEASYFHGLGESHVPPANVLAHLPAVTIVYDDRELSHSAQAAAADSALREQFLAEFFSYYPSVLGLRIVAAPTVISRYQLAFVQKHQSYNVSGGCLWPLKAAVVGVPASVERADDPQGPGYAIVLFWRPTSRTCQILVEGKLASLYSAQPEQQLIFPMSTAGTSALGRYVGGSVLQAHFAYVCGSQPASPLESLCSAAGLRQR